MSTTLNIGFVAIARPTFDTALAAEMAARARAQLLSAGLALTGPETLVMDESAAQAVIRELQQAPIDLLLLFQATFADSSVAVDLARSIDAPALLWALPEERTGGRLRLNSFCGINLAGYGLRRAGLRYHYVYALPGDPAPAEEVRILARAGRARRLLRTARVGQIGEHPHGFDPCGYDGDALAKKLGVQVVARELEPLFQKVRAVNASTVDPILSSLAERVDGLEALDPSAVRCTLSSYVELREIASQETLAGLAVRCWPEFFTELGCAACGAMSMLSDELTPCSCEADVNGTITQLILQWLSDEPAFGTDMVGFDVERDEAVVWHCGLAPLSMADPATRPRTTVHSNRKLPLLMEFALKPGRVTIARLSQATGEYRLVIGGGEMLAAPPSFSGTSGVLRFDRPAGEVLDTIMHEGLDHHISLTYGDHVASLIALAEMLDLPILRLA